MIKLEKIIIHNPNIEIKSKFQLTKLKVELQKKFNLSANEILFRY